jgi:hypothetical protein
MMPPSWKTEIEETVEKAAHAASERQKAENDKNASEISTEIKALTDAYKAEKNKPEKTDKVKRVFDIATVFLLFATAVFTGLASRAAPHRNLGLVLCLSERFPAVAGIRVHATGLHDRL